jgi:hypothetical protein
MIIKFNNLNTVARYDFKNEDTRIFIDADILPEQESRSFCDSIANAVLKQTSNKFIGDDGEVMDFVIFADAAGLKDNNIEFIVNESLDDKIHVYIPKEIDSNNREWNVKERKHLFIYTSSDVNHDLSFYITNTGMLHDMIVWIANNDQHVIDEMCGMNDDTVATDDEENEEIEVERNEVEEALKAMDNLGYGLSIVELDHETLKAMKMGDKSLRWKNGDQYMEELFRKANDISDQFDFHDPKN